MMDRHYITNIEGGDNYHPKCVSLVELINILSNNALMVLECEEFQLTTLARLEINKQMEINDLKIKRII